MVEKRNGTLVSAFMAGFSTGASPSAPKSAITDDTLVRLTMKSDQPAPPCTAWSPCPRVTSRVPHRVADVELFLEMTEQQSTKLRLDLIDRGVSDFEEFRVELA